MLGFHLPPQFKVGMLVEVKNPSRRMIIQNVRRVRPNGEQRKQWVYDGAIIDIKEGVIRLSVYTTCVLESQIASRVV